MKKRAKALAGNLLAICFFRLLSSLLRQNFLMMKLGRASWLPLDYFIIRDASSGARRKHAISSVYNAACAGTRLARAGSDPTHMLRLSRCQH